MKYQWHCRIVLHVDMISNCWIFVTYAYFLMWCYYETQHKYVFLYNPTWSMSYKMLEISWWRHQMETFSALLAICAGNSPASGEFPAQRPVTRSFNVFFDLCLNKRLRKQSWGWWFETISHPLWRHCNDSSLFIFMQFTVALLCRSLHLRGSVVTARRPSSNVTLPGRLGTWLVAVLSGSVTMATVPQVGYNTDCR